jgi:hypothetical protein
MNLPNRRVPAELDRIVLRALARDVQDRYQTAQEFADDLGALIAGYRFNPEKLKELIRGLFRTDYQKEIDEIEACHHSSMLPPSVRESLGMFQEQGQDDAPEIEITSDPPPDGQVVTSAETNVHKGGGFWKRFKNRFSRE